MHIFVLLYSTVWLLLILEVIFVTIPSKCRYSFLFVCLIIDVCCCLHYTAVILSADSMSLFLLPVCHLVFFTVFYDYLSVEPFFCTSSALFLSSCLASCCFYSSYDTVIKENECYVFIIVLYLACCGNRCAL